MSNIEIYLNVHKDGWVCVSVGCPVGDDDRWACKHFDGAEYTPVQIWCAARQESTHSVNGCLFAHGVSMARGQKNKEVAADAFIYGVRKRLQFAKEIAP